MNFQSFFCSGSSHKYKLHLLLLSIVTYICTCQGLRHVPQQMTALRSALTMITDGKCEPHDNTNTTSNTKWHKTHTVVQQAEIWMRVEASCTSYALFSRKVHLSNLMSPEEHQLLNGIHTGYHPLSVPLCPSFQSSVQHNKKLPIIITSKSTVKGIPLKQNYKYEVITYHGCINQYTTYND
jgi:hypothetical protein